MQNLDIDLTNALPFVGQGAYREAIGRASTALDRLGHTDSPGSEWLGWRRILTGPDKGLISRIDECRREIRIRSGLFVVCGIGGSYLGSRAVSEALCGPFPEDGPELLYAGHQMGGRYLERLLKRLDREVEGGSHVSMNVISKSGSTLETALAFRALRAWFERTYGERAAERIVVTTAPEGGILNRIADEQGYMRFAIPDDVGGRFSVLTPAGLLPAGVAGVDIEALFEGARSACLRLEKDPRPVLEHAALRYNMHEQGVAVDLIGSFEPDLGAFSGWARQLLGESEGKGGKGIFPAMVSYSTDLHSIGQMVQQGRRNMMETILEVEQPPSGFVPCTEANLGDGLDDLAGLTIHEINRQALLGTVEAHREGGVPVVRIRLSGLNATVLGELIYHFQLMTAVYVRMLGLNPFDQPGVEAYKRAMYRNLGRES